jgi:cell division protein FtsZ
VFITGGMGGGTGTGGAPVVAEVARELDILTVAIVTRPFLFEGKIRDRNARKGIDELRKHVDTIIIIPNQKLMSVVDRKTPLLDAFRQADDVLYQATRGISDLISVPGLVNLDFADVKTIMKGMGDALMGTGEAEGEDRSVNAAEFAIHSPLLDDINIVGAKGILINICGGEDMTLYDVSDATQTIYDAVGDDTESNIIFGAVTDPSMNGKVRVTVIATGFNEDTICGKPQEQGKGSKPRLNLNQSKPVVEDKAEQMSFSLVQPKVQTSQPAPVERVEPEVAEAPAPAAPANNVHEFPQPAEPQAAAETEVRHEENEETCEEDDGQQPAFELPPFLKKDTSRREPQVFVSKGQVITHYEDDMDVPTFLRKQMQ